MNTTVASKREVWDNTSERSTSELYDKRDDSGHQEKSNGNDHCPQEMSTCKVFPVPGSLAPSALKRSRPDQSKDSERSVRIRSRSDVTVHSIP